MTAYKAKVKAVYPCARCIRWGGEWCVIGACPLPIYGSGKTAFAAWVDAWREIEKERGGK